MFCDLSFIFPFSFMHITSYLLQLALQMASHNLTILTVSVWYEAEAVFMGIGPLCFSAGYSKGQGLLCEVLCYKQHELCVF